MKSLRVITIPGNISLYHATVRNKPDIDYDQYPSAKFLKPEEPFSTDLLNHKYFHISEDALRYWGSNEDLQKLVYTTSRPLHLVDLYSSVTDIDKYYKNNKISNYLLCKFKDDPNNTPIDGIFNIDFFQERSGQICLFRPWSCLYSNFSLFNLEDIEDYDGLVDNTKFMDSVIGKYRLRI